MVELNVFNKNETMKKITNKIYDLEMFSFKLHGFKTKKFISKPQLNVLDFKTIFFSKTNYIDLNKKRFQYFFLKQILSPNTRFVQNQC